MGTTIAGRYRVRSIIGHGGMGVVFEGVRLEDGVAVALKLPRVELTDSSGAARLAREGAFTGKVSHRNVVGVLETGQTEDGLPFLALERLVGETLGDYLASCGSLTPEAALAWILPLCGAVALAHDAGIVHRDLKPDNIFLHRQGNDVVPKLLDFGLAREAADARLTRSGVAVGTPEYMAPEQRRGDNPDASSVDVWALTAVLYRCLAGSPPPTFAPGAQGSGDFRPYEALAHSTLAIVMERGLRAEPAQRYPSVRALVEALAAAATRDGIPVPSEPDPIGLPGWSSWIEPGTATVSAAIPQEELPQPPVGSHRLRPGIHRGTVFAFTLVVAATMAATAPSLGTRTRPRTYLPPMTTLAPPQPKPKSTNARQRAVTSGEHAMAALARTTMDRPPTTRRGGSTRVDIPPAMTLARPRAAQPAKVQRTRKPQLRRDDRQRPGSPSHTERHEHPARPAQAGLQRDFGEVPRLEAVW